MRRLLYVPIVHDEADLGSAGPHLARASAALAGGHRWARHQETARQFWESIGAFLLALSSPKLKIYQDGLAAGGAEGKRVVQEAARRGSRNYQLISELLQRGAELRTTEDPALLLEEREAVLDLLEPVMAREPGPRPHLQTERARLLEARDRFIAGTINATLKEEELGVLFIGAHHNVVPHLAGNVAVQAVKEREKVLAYFEELFRGKRERSFVEWGEYLASPVEVSLVDSAWPRPID